MRRNGTKPRRVRGWLALAATLAAAVVLAQELPDEPADDTPRGAVRGYLLAGRDGDWDEAAGHLDLRALPPEARVKRGAKLARDLKEVLDRTLWIEVEDLSASPEGEAGDGLPPSLDRVGSIETAGGPVDVLVERVSEPDGRRVWKIARATVAKIPALVREFGYGALAAVLPPVLFEVRFLEVQLWQWLGLVLLGALAVLVSWLAARIVVGAARALARRSETNLDDALVTATAAPLRLTFALWLFEAGSRALAFSVPVQAAIDVAVRVLTVATVTWFVVRVIDVVARAVELRFAERGQKAAISVVPLGRRTLKVVIAMLAGVVLLQNLGWNVTGLVAGLGIGGLALALAAQKTLENLFGGVTLITDQPVRVGDFCRFGDRVGTVEDIGLRSTRVRTLDRTVVTIPNAEFAGVQLENYALRDRIWLSTTIGVRYETTPDQLRHLLVELKKLLLAHPKIHPDPARVRFAGFGAYSLDLEIFAYVLTTDINEFFAVREDVFLRIMDVVAASGTGFAFPSQTIYAAADEGLDAARRQAAEAQVQQWRAARQLPLPDVPSDVAAGLRDTLDYPPAGSVSRR